MDRLAPEARERLHQLERELLALREERDRLRLQAARWQSLLQEAHFGIVVYAPDGSIREASRGMQRLFDLTEPESEVARRTYNVLADPQLRAKGLDALVRAAFSGEPVELPRTCYEVETPVEGRSVQRWVEGSFYPIVDLAGKLVEVVAIQIDVTPLMQTQQELRSSQEKLTDQLRELDQLYATAPVGFALLDTDLRYLRVNDRLSEMNGIPAADHLGRSFRELVPALASEVEPILHRVIETGESSISHSLRGRSADQPNVERDWLVSYYPLMTSQETVRAIGVIVQEVSEVRRAERALVEAERRLGVVIEGADLVLWAIDRQGTFTLSEGRALQRLGLSPGEVVGRSLFDLYGENPAIVDATRRALAGEAVSRIIEVGDLAFDARFLPLTDESGDTIGVTGVALDVTTRERAFEALRESEGRFRDIAENIREVFWLFDLERQRVAYLSPAFEGIWGRTIDEVYDDAAVWFESVHAEDRALIDRVLAKIIETGQGESLEYRIVRPDGTIRWILDSGFAIRDEGGEIRCLAGIAEDISDRRQAEMEQRRFEARMQQMQKLESLGVLAGGIAHDFNNLLMVVLGHADLALLSLPAGLPSREHVEKIQTAAQRASELADQMLAYAGKGRFRIEPVDLNEIVREMSHLLESGVSKKIELSLELEPELPSIEADASQMRQIVMNLITNAVEAIGPENGRIWLTTSTVHADEEYLAQCEPGSDITAGSCVVLEVVDTGCGIDDGLRRKIFDPFFTTKFRGRGLGLAAVSGIVRRHGGGLRMTSEQAVGTTFSVLFPPASAPVTHEPAPPTVDEQPAGAETILVVDDDASVRELARQMLESAGYEVLTAADGREGVELFRRRRDEVDLVLLDVTMPGLDGKEAYSELCRIRPDVGVVLMSGYSAEDVTAQTGPLAFVHKPYRLTELLAAVRSVLAGT